MLVFLHEQRKICAFMLVIYDASCVVITLSLLLWLDMSADVADVNVKRLGNCANHINEDLATRQQVRGIIFSHLTLKCKSRRLPPICS